MDYVVGLATAYDYDDNYIYYVLSSPIIYNVNVDSVYTVNDWGTEEFTGTEVALGAQTLYGQNLRDKLRTDVVTISAQSLTQNQKNQVCTNIGAVNKAGDTMTGTLYIYRADNSPGLVLKNGFADMSGTETATKAWFLYCQDKDGDLAGFFSVNHTTTGRASVAIAASNISNGSAVSNALELRMERDGTRSVAFTSPTAWREALGLGSSGNLPITIAQGGSGQTAVQYYNTAANLFTPASGVTILSVAGALWGKVLSINIAVRKTTAVTTASDFSIGTVVAGKRPRVTSNIGISGGNITTGNIDGSGNVNLHGTVTANGNLYIFATYVIQ